MTDQTSRRDQERGGPKNSGTYLDDPRLPPPINMAYRRGDREDAAAEQDREDEWPSFLVIYCICHLRLKPLPGPYITSPPPGRVGWSQLLREV
ncbi:hypothetical protein MCOR29_004641 [Pyricularia oryzae]|nr:hypothetical protein MCOR29_004641 [Pyricularia oryzae]